MYSGGRGYFDALSLFFQQSSSCVALQNTNWLILGLDTAYVDFNLSPAQVQWITQMIAAAGTRKVILCSHHQPFSSLDDQGRTCRPRSGRCSTRNASRPGFGDTNTGSSFTSRTRRGREGAVHRPRRFSVGSRHAAWRGGDLYHWIHLKQRPHAPEAMLFDGPNFWVTAAPDKYSPHGFVFLELDSANTWETYRTPDNRDRAAVEVVRAR